jgi:hypothetical protein
MTQASFPFEGIDTTETQFSKWARHFNNGVNDEPTGTALEVSAGTGLAVDVEAGEAMVRGHYYISDATESLALATADATNDRIDVVVLRLDPTANSIVLAVKTGTPDAAPTAPALVQTDAGIFEQALANVLVAATSGVPGTITDRREFMGTRLGSWSTAGRPDPAGRVLFGFNTDTERIEFYNTETPGWQDVTPASIGDIGDVTITSAVEGDTLVYDGTDWVNTSQVSGDNLLYNGAMQVAQRGTSTANITTSGYYTADRWSVALGSLGTWTQTVEADGPTGSGFAKSLKMECTTAEASPAGSGFLLLNQRLEGQDLQALKKGSSSAEPLTLSFWIKSNVTGTFISELEDSDNSRTISASYTVSVVDTWERKTITFAGDTTGAFDNDNGRSLDLVFWLGSGSDFSSGTLQTSWGADVNANRAVGQVNLAETIGNYWQITGVQLETGEVATPFEHKPYGVELAECQRYYTYIAGPGSAQAFATGFYASSTSMHSIVPLPVTMRTIPSLDATSGSSFYRIASTTGSDNFDSLTLSGESTANSLFILNSTEISGTGGNAGRVMTLTSGRVAADAEL